MHCVVAARSCQAQRLQLSSQKAHQFLQAQVIAVWEGMLLELRWLLTRLTWTTASFAPKAQEVRGGHLDFGNDGHHDSGQPIVCNWTVAARYSELQGELGKVLQREGCLNLDHPG